MTLTAQWMQEEFYRRIVVRYRGDMQGSIIRFDNLPFSKIISMSILFSSAEGIAFISNKLPARHHWQCSLYLQGHGEPRRHQPELVHRGSRQQMEEDIVMALLLIE